MIRPRFISALAVAAMMAAPVYAAKSHSTSTDTQPSGRSSTASSPSLPPCSSLEAGNSGHAHPNAGKLADKSTGEAKEHSASPVHEDCAPDTASSGTSSSSGASPSATTSGATSASPSSTTGSTAGTTSSVTGSTANSTNSMNGSTSTVSPNIDLRGRSTLNLDNTTTTGNQSLGSSTNATTGSQTSTDTTTQGTSSSTSK